MRSEIPVVKQNQEATFGKGEKSLSRCQIPDVVTLNPDLLTRLPDSRERPCEVICSE
jgi:hypothetical protein